MYAVTFGSRSRFVRHRKARYQHQRYRDNDARNG